MDKRMTAADIVAELQDGMTIGIGGWGPRRKPMALIREILRSELKYLTIVVYYGADVSMLCAAGKVKKVVFAFVSLDLKLDVSLLHVDRADQRGVCQIKGSDQYMDDWFARAAKKTFVTCDELVDANYFNNPAESRYVFWERAMTSGVCLQPGGAHPTSCAPLYGFDVPHFKEYNASAKEDGFEPYFAKFIKNSSEEEYQSKVGGLKAIRQLPLPVY
ncbi:CoA transferase subunit A [Endozoicomonas sp. SCSIO W0465]|uniref:CoA transferase subunit A n=1 Tax=Endozoicomonas sp. SCSIO W0465 TaxID=2918516 RepID=UPI002074DCEB|nr:CoA-transferase [Endozoicomonas sp. SCSIO W0465]USE34925.1 hypothetical protein MJO57_22795 [Endozoicomonas sp. SCSIO W0465]